MNSYKAIGLGSLTSKDAGETRMQFSNMVFT